MFELYSDTWHSFLLILTEERIPFFDGNQGIHSIGTYLDCFSVSFTVINWCNPSIFILIFLNCQETEREHLSVASVCNL